MRHLIGIHFGIVALTAALAAAQQQPQVHSGIGASNPAAKPHPQVRMGIQNRAPRPRVYRVPPSRVQAQKVARPIQIQPPATRPQPVAVPAPTPAPTPFSMKPIQPSEMPPVPPQVTYRDGMLTVQAVNSTLGSLLQTIRNKTGIQFEGAQNADERVAVTVGPAPEAEVLASIFNGSKYDYLVIGREDDPAIVQRVILTPRGRANAQNIAPPQPPPQIPQEADQEVPDEEVDADQPEDTPVDPPQVTPPPTAQADQPSMPPTPQQLLEEMKRMEQKQQGQIPHPNQVPRKPGAPPQ